MCAYFENSDTITDGTPAGCTSGADTTWDKTNGPESYSTTNNPAPSAGGSYNLYKDHTGWSYVWIGDPGISWAEGTLQVDIYMPTYNANDTIFMVYSGDTGYFGLYTGASDGIIKFDYYNGAGDHMVTDSTHFTAGAWHTITIKWKPADLTTQLSIQVDANAPVTYTTGAFTAGSGAIGYVNFGSIPAQSFTIYYADNLFIDTVWK